MGQQVSKTPDDAATSELVQRFLNANGHDLAEAHRLQDTVSVAYAMFVIHKELRLTEAKAGSLQDLLKRSSEEARSAPVPAVKAASDAVDNDGPVTKKRKKQRR